MIVWIRSLGFWGMFAGGFGAISALANNDYDIALLGVGFAAVSYVWYWGFGKLVK